MSMMFLLSFGAVQQNRIGFQVQIEIFLCDRRPDTLLNALNKWMLVRCGRILRDIVQIRLKALFIEYQHGIMPIFDVADQCILDIPQQVHHSGFGIRLFVMLSIGFKLREHIQLQCSRVHQRMVDGRLERDFWNFSWSISIESDGKSENPSLKIAALRKDDAIPRCDVEQRRRDIHVGNRISA